MAQILFIGFAAPGANAIVGPANVVYVEPAPKGNNATGQRGNAGLPFATIAAAMAVMQTGDQMRIAPGNYVCDNVTIPAGVTALSLVGAGRGTTRLGSTLAGGGNGCLIFGPTISSFLAMGMDIEASNDPTDVPIVVVGGGGAGATLNDGMFLQDCAIRGGDNSIELTDCGPCILRDCRIRDGSLYADNSRFTTFDCTMDGGAGLVVSWTGGVDAPVKAPNQHFALSGNPNVTLVGAPHVEFDPACRLGNITSPVALTQVGAGGGSTPQIRVRCPYGNTTLILPDTADACVIDYRDSAPTGVSDFIVTGAAGNFQAVIMDGANITAQGPNQVIARDGIDLRIFSDAVFSSIFSTPGTGTITPSKWTGTSTLAGAANVLAFGFNASSAPRSAVATPDLPGSGQIGITKTAADVTLAPAVPGAFNADVIVRWN